MSRLPEYAQLEIVVANGCGAATERAIAERFPAVRTVPAPPGASLAETRNAAIQQSTGEIVAVLNERYQTPADWIKLISDAHALHRAEVIAGCIAPPPRLSAPEWAIFLTEYWRLTRTPQRGLRDDGLLDRKDAVMIPGGNVSYKRSVFERASMSGYMWELDFHAALFERGAAFYRQGEIVAVYGTPPALSEYFAERWALSRELAARRGAGISLGARLVAMAARLALPVLIVGRVGLSMLGPNRKYAIRFLQALPWIVAFSVVQAWGEIAGLAKRNGTPGPVGQNHRVIS